MTDVKRLLEVRKRAKDKKPLFIKQDAHKKTRVGSKWRRPRGLHSKVRLCKKGYRRSVSKGYRSPLLVRGFHKKGLKGRVVNSLKDIDEIKKGDEGIIISQGVGLRKKTEIVKKAVEKSVRIINIKDPAKFLSSVEEILKKKKEEKERRKGSKEKKRKEKEKKAEEKKTEEDKKKAEDKPKEMEGPDKEEELEKEKKKEMDKILIKREV